MEKQKERLNYCDQKSIYSRLEKEKLTLLRNYAQDKQKGNMAPLYTISYTM